MIELLPILALGAAIIDWFACTPKTRFIQYIAGPAVMIFLLIFLLASGGNTFPLAWFSLGIFFSLIGDILLMLPNKKFSAGLIAFVTAHLCYIAGFLTSHSSLNFASLAVIGLVAFSGVLIFRRIHASLKISNQKNLIIPVLLYSVVISVMLASALLTLVITDSVWPVLPSLLVSLGALLFYISDVILAWNQFVQPLPRARLWNLSTYHLGQISIVIGVTLVY